MLSCWGMHVVSWGVLVCIHMVSPRDKQDQSLSVTSLWRKLHNFDRFPLTVAVVNDWTRSFWCTPIRTYVRTYVHTHTPTSTHPPTHTHTPTRIPPHTQCPHTHTVYFTFHYSKTLYNGYNGVELKSGKAEHALKHKAH